MISNSNCNSYNQFPYMKHFGQFLLTEINHVLYSNEETDQSNGIDHLNVEPVFGPHCGPDGSDIISRLSSQIFPDGWIFQLNYRSYSVSFSEACGSHDLCLAAGTGPAADTKCDERFRADLSVACTSLPFSLRHNCDRLGFAYYSAATAWTQIRNSEELA